MNDKVQLRYDTNANWDAENPILLAGEYGYAYDSPKKLKVGDGSTAWTSLPDALSSSFSPTKDSGTASSGAVTIDDAQVCVITTESLSTAEGAIEQVVLTSNQLVSGVSPLVMIQKGTNTQGVPVLKETVLDTGATTLTINILNVQGQVNSNALNGSLIIIVFIL